MDVEEAISDSDIDYYDTADESQELSDEDGIHGIEEYIETPGSSQTSDLPEEASSLLRELSLSAEPKMSGGTSMYKVSPFLTALIGQANMSFVRRDFDETLRLCKEIIKIDAHIPEPYRTMSEMYEEVGEHEKALQLGMIAASNSLRDAEGWAALGDKAVDLERREDAIYCYTKAVKINPALYETILSLIKILEPSQSNKGSLRTIISCYQKLVKNAPIELQEKIMEYAQMGAALCHEENDLKTALILMEEGFRRVPDKVTLNDVNLIVELHVQLQQFREALEVIVTYCDIYVEGEEDVMAEDGSEATSTVFRVTECTIGQEPLPLEIRGKLAVILIHLQAFQLTENVIAPFVDAVEEYGDVVIEIAEAFMAENRHVDALKVLKLLIASKSFSAAQVWYHYAECLRKLNRKEEAVSAYSVVMELAPQHAEARLIVSVLLNELGRGEEAIDALAQDPNSGYVDVGMLFERCLLLRDNPARTAEFLVVGRLLLSRHCARFRNRPEYVSFVRYWKARKNTELVKRFHEQQPEEPMYIEGKRMPTKDEEFQLFLDLCDRAFESKQFALLQRLTCSSLGSKVLCSTREKEERCISLAALSIFLNKDSYSMLNFYRNLIPRGFDTPRVWNLFNMVATNLDDNRFQKYITRLLIKRPDHNALPIIFANNCFSSGSYKQAVSEYLLIFKHDPSPLVAFLIAVTFLHIALQKFNQNVNVVVNQAIGYLSQYRELRGEGCSQETHYNSGRMYHQIGLYPHAIYHYKKVLETAPPDEFFDLKREAAFNLSRIYIASKSYDLARMYIQKYIVI